MMERLSKVAVPEGVEELRLSLISSPAEETKETEEPTEMKEASNEELEMTEEMKTECSEDDKPETMMPSLEALDGLNR